MSTLNHNKDIEYRKDKYKKNDNKKIDYRKYNTIENRLNFVQDILKNNRLEPIVDFEHLETERFIYPNRFAESSGNGSSGSNDSTYDIRSAINKRIFNFYNVINDIGGKLKYIKSGSTGHTFKGIIANNNDNYRTNYAVKVVAYPKKEYYGDINDTRRPENAELMMIRLLSYFVIKKQTPHIVLPIGTFYTSIVPFVNLIDGEYVSKDNKKYQEFINRYKKKEYYHNVSILISEWANKGDLLDFIRKQHLEFTTMTWKVFFFQILSVLAVIQSKFPDFRHNDLKANNILVHKIQSSCKKFSYTICKKKYKIPNISYIIKLWDFDFACIPGIVDNSKVDANWTNQINVKPVRNRYYDVHYFFNTLIKKGFFPDLVESSNISQDIKDFLERILPQKFREGKYVTKRGRILLNKEYMTPDSILSEDPFFEEFRS